MTRKSRRGVQASSDVTLASYQTASQRYREQAGPQSPAVVAFIERLASLVGTGHILELGSGPGREANYLETLGPHVTRTDATPAFVETMRTEGHEAKLLDMRTDDLGVGFDAIFANAALLHLSREEFANLLVRARRAVVDAGLVAFTLKEGDGEAWSNAKLDLPRHFTFWREPALRAALEASGWSVVTIDHVEGRTEPWLFVLASTA